MGRTHAPYPPEFRRQMIELVRAGRSPEDLAEQFEPSAQAIRNWVQQADRDEGRRADGLTSAERDELSRLRRENRQRRQERGPERQRRRRSILAQAAAWCAREAGAIPSGSAHSSARPRPCTQSRRCAGCLASRQPAMTLGDSADPRLAAKATPPCCAGSERSTRCRKAPMGPHASMPTSKPRASRSVASGSPG